MLRRDWGFEKRKGERKAKNHGEVWGKKSWKGKKPCRKRGGRGKEKESGELQNCAKKRMKWTRFDSSRMAAG